MSIGCDHVLYFLFRFICGTWTPIRARDSWFGIVKHRFNRSTDGMNTWLKGSGTVRREHAPDPPADSRSMRGPLGRSQTFGRRSRGDSYVVFSRPITERDGRKIPKNEASKVANDSGSYIPGIHPTIGCIIQVTVSEEMVRDTAMWTPTLRETLGISIISFSVERSAGR